MKGKVRNETMRNVAGMNINSTLTGLKIDRVRSAYPSENLRQMKQLTAHKGLTVYPS